MKCLQGRRGTRRRGLKLNEQLRDSPGGRGGQPVVVVVFVVGQAPQGEPQGRDIFDTRVSDMLYIIQLSFISSSYIVHFVTKDGDTYTFLKFLNSLL